MPHAQSAARRVVSSLSRLSWSRPASGRPRPAGLRLLAFMACLLAGAAGALAQNIQYTKNSTDLQQRGELRVNPSTRALEFQLTLANYLGRAGLNLPVTLSYSSKVWRVKFQGYNPGGYSSNGQPLGNGYTMVSAEYAEQTMAGWTSSLGFPAMDFSGEGAYDQFGNPTGSNCGEGGCFNVGRIRVRMPDGSTHELRSSDQPYNATSPPPPPDDYYAVDGSRLRYQVSTNTLFLPDGSRYVNLYGSPQLYVDRNGNTLTYDAFNRRWTDTLGRVIGDPLASPSYSPPGFAAPYTLVWKSLGDPGVLTTPQSLRYVANQGCPQSAEQGGSPYLFPSGENNTHICNAGGPGQYFNPAVLHQIVLPTGQSYTFTYNVYGEIDKVVLPTGGYERFEYGQFMGVSSMSYPYAQANRGVTKRHVSATGAPADEKTWTYSGSSGFVSVTAPDQTLSERYMYTDSPMGGTFGYSSGGARAGLTYDERYYSAPDGSGVRRMLRRKLTEWAVTGSNATGQFPGAQQYANRNPRVVKEVELLLDTGGDALAKITTYGYDTTYEFSTGAYQTSVNEYGYVSVPQSTAQTAPVGSFAPPAQWLRRTEYDYLDATNSAYRLRNLLGLKKEMRVKNAAGAVVAQTTTSYDEPAYPLVSYGPITQWADPGTGVRGNATTVSRWLDTVGAYVQAHTQYDQAGSPVNAWDANGNLTQTAYSPAYAYAYPTSVTTPAPDPNNTGFGSNVGLVTTTAYDFSTGLVTSVTDPNGKTTSYQYADPLNRLTRVDLPDGGRTINNYVDAHQCGAYVETRTLLDSSGREVHAWQFFDGLGRPYLAESDDGQDTSSPYLRRDTLYDVMGRVWKISNPYRSPGCGATQNPSGRWTTTAYDALGRVVSVTTPDGAVVSTSYSGNVVTVTDQAGKKRSSVSDALGRLTQVTEDPTAGGLNYVTTYTYDVLGNLRKVDQGGQLRFFMYDSLSRLIRAKNPEQAAGSAASNITDPVTGNGQWSTAYGYDNNGNPTARVDARNVWTYYGYDGLNRNTTVRYTDGTKDVDRHYDGAVNGKGRLWYFNWDASNNTRFDTHLAIDEYDALGRVKKYRQHFLTNGVASPQFLVTYAYDKAGNPTSMSYPSGHTVTYAYDAAGRLSSFTGNLGDGVQRTYAAGITYSEFGGMQEERFGTATPLYHKLHYNRQGQLFDIRLSTVPWATDQWNWNRGAVVNYFSGNYAWEGDPNTPAGPDNNGNLRRQQSWVPGDDWYNGYAYAQDTFEYDALNRLTQVSEVHGGAWGQSGQDFAQYFDYDRWGNRTINPATTDGMPEPQFSVDTATNRLGVPAGYGGRMDYDAAGNLTNDTYTSFGRDDGTPTRIYDAENRLTLVKDGNLQTVSAYTYDADGRRVKRKIGNAEWWQVYGPGGELLAEYPAGSAPFLAAKEYGYRGGELLVTMASGDVDRLRRFVKNLYYNCLARDPNPTELQQKVDQLAQAGAQGGEPQLLSTARAIARGLFESTEYVNRNRTTEQYVTDLYNAYLQRGPDSGGLNFWVNNTNQYGRGATLNAFEVSTEFATLAATVYGTASGGEDQRVDTFVRNFYYGAFQREPNATEAQAGRQRLNNAAAVSRDQVIAEARAFGVELIQSTNYNAHHTVEQYVTDLYQAFLQRAPDGPGLNHWVNHTNQFGRAATLDAFRVAIEFGELAGTLYRETFWLVTDQLGTPRMVANRTGSLVGVKRHDYLPFGEELSAGTGGRAQGYGAIDNVRQKFTGYERDNETGLDYASARYYSWAQGRFTSPDPFLASGKVGVPQSWNRYTYCLNNPLRYVDPNGLIWGTKEGEQYYRWFATEAEMKAEGYDAATRFVYEIDGVWYSVNPNANEHRTFSNDWDARVQFNKWVGLQDSRYDWIPFVRGARSFLFNYTIGDHQAAFGSFVTLSFEGGTAGGVGRAVAAGKSAAKSLLDDAGGLADETYEIIDGVRRAKAAERLGKDVIRAEIRDAAGNTVGVRDVPIDKLLAPFEKSAIDVSPGTAMDRWMRVFNATKSNTIRNPIEVTPGKRGIPIKDVGFGAGGP